MSSNPLYSDKSAERINALAANMWRVIPAESVPSEVSLALHGVLVRYVAERVECADDLDKAVDLLHRGLDLLALSDRKKFFGEQSDPDAG